MTIRITELDKLMMMKRTIYLSLILAMTIGLLGACGETGESKTNNETQANNNKNVTVPDSSMELVGVWYLPEKEQWVEFREDGSFSKGAKGKDTFDGKQWLYDSVKGNLVMKGRNEKSEKHFKVHFNHEDGVQYAIFTKEGGKNQNRYTKVDKRPVY